MRDVLRSKLTLGRVCQKHYCHDAHRRCVDGLHLLLVLRGCQPRAEVVSVYDHGHDVAVAAAAPQCHLRIEYSMAEVVLQ